MEKSEEEKLEEDEVDLRQYRPARGPIVLTLVELPPSSKTIGQWTIQKGIHTHCWHFQNSKHNILVVSEAPQTFIYPQELSRTVEQVAPVQSDESMEGGGVTTPPAIVPGCAQWPAFKITKKSELMCYILQINVLIFLSHSKVFRHHFTSYRNHTWLSGTMNSTYGEQEWSKMLNLIWVS